MQKMNGEYKYDLSHILSYLLRTLGNTQIFFGAWLQALKLEFGLVVVWFILDSW